MKKLVRNHKHLVPALAVAFATLVSTAAQVVVNEIMFHPMLNTPAEEFIELFNRSSTNVNLGGWRLEQGVDFVFPANSSIGPGEYLVIAEDTNRFRSLYPTVEKVAGNWIGTLNNSRQTVRLVNAAGQEINEVSYADEGDWAVRTAGVLHWNHRGWDWLKEADGFGKTLELRNAALPDIHGQNWGASVPFGGTPGRVNSLATDNLQPMILDVGHFPIIPKSTNSVNISARILDESAAVTVFLHYRIDSTNPGPFITLPMFDDGQHQDGAAGDQVYGAAIPPATNDTVVEFYLRAEDPSGRLRTWPAPALLEDGATQAQAANLLYQVDDRINSSTQPFYKLIMREVERAELARIGSSGEANSDAQMNGTFVSIGAGGTEVRYLVGIRNRGHGSRNRQPNNYRVNFRTDDTWNGVEAINLNGQFSYLQHLGAVLSFQAGVAGAYSVPAQVRVNNTDLSLSAGLDRSYGSYAANESLNSDWAELHFPNDSNGNIYRAIRDLAPGDLGYRGPDWQSYTNSYFKASNEAENQWDDLIHLTHVLTNAPDASYESEVRQVVNVEQWLRHIAVMALFDSRETGLNTGHGDDYFMYRGTVDTRFNLLFYDLDTIIGLGSSTNGTIFGVTNMPAFARFITHFRTNYLVTLDELMKTTFSKEHFDAVVDHTLGSYVPAAVRENMKVWMEGRRQFVRSEIESSLPKALPVALISGIPRERTALTSALVQVSGEGVTHYKYQLNNGPASAEFPAEEVIDLQDLPNGTHSLRVFGRNAVGDWQIAPTVSPSWTVDRAWPAVRINEVLASNRTAVPRDGAFPDLIELFNEGSTAVNLTGYSLAKSADGSSRYFFPTTSTIEPGGFLVLTATDSPATASNTGFTIGATGDSVVLLASGPNSTAFVVDSVTFGNQLADFSVARVSGGQWTLGRPTFGATNIAESLSPVSAVVINEWLAAPQTGSSEFVELFNRDALPVNIGGLFLTDQPIGFPGKQRLSDLTFVSGRAFFVFSQNGVDAALEFGLNASSGEIALMQGAKRIDSVAYTAEREGVSSGRTPDGEIRFAPFNTPTPGGPNARPDFPMTAQLVTLLPMNHIWKYDQSGSDLGSNWRGTNFNDVSWASGPALLADEDSTLIEPIRTQLSVNGEKRTFYFRTKFTVDPGVTVSGLQVNHIIDDGAVFYLNGQEIGPRFNMPSGDIAFHTLALSDVSNARVQGPYKWPVQLLRPGENTLAVEVHQYRSNSTDIAFGLGLEALVITNTATQAGVMLNEILTQNSTLREPDGSTPDWIELYNPSTNDLDLAGLALSDDPAAPRKWVFPAGSILRANDYLTVMCDNSKAPNTTNTGFALQGSGGAVYLHGPVADGSPLLDSIRYGLLPKDFSLGRIANTANGSWVLNLPTLGRANMAANLGSPSALRINEWLANPTSGEDDWFELFNLGTLPVELSGLLLSDDPAEPGKSAIPARSYIGVAADRFVQFVADDNVANGPNHTAFKLSSTADHIVLSRADGIAIDAISFVDQASGISEGRLPDGAAEITSFSDTISPGHPNFVFLTNAVINEILTHTDPPLEDAIELLNHGTGPIDLSGWFLSDDQDDPKKFAIPPGTMIAPGAFKVFYENQFNTLPGDPGSFSLSSANGDSVILSEAAAGGVLTGRRTVAAFGPAENGVSFGRIQTSTGVDYAAMRARSFGRDLPSSVEDFRLGTGAVNAGSKVGPIIISELMFFPPMLGTNDNVRDEFIELQNTSNASVSLFDPARTTNRWHLRGGIGFDLPALTLPPGGVLVIVSFDPANDTEALAAFRQRYGTVPLIVGPYSGKLGNEDDVVELLKPDEPQLDTGEVPYILVEKVDYAQAAPWPLGIAGSGQSLHRRFQLAEWLYGNEAFNWVPQAATPGVREGVADAGDQDGDGMADDWEQTHGFNPLSAADASIDSDGDGLINLTEFLLGTDPRNTLSSFRAELRRESGGHVLVFVATAGRTFIVQGRDRFASGDWSQEAEYPAGPRREIALPVHTGNSARFYRVVTSP